MFANTVSRSRIRRVALPIGDSAPGRVIFDVATADFTVKSKAANVIDFAKRDRAPLLLIAGDRDHLMPESVVYENFARYRRSPAPTDLKVFHGRPHLITVLDGWEDVADHAVTWAGQRIA